MPFFSIYEPISGPTHYVTVTLIGFQLGVSVRWSPNQEGWRPQVVHLSALAGFTGSRLDGYSLKDPDDIDGHALEAMTGQRRTHP
jgi:hypothetical protein